MVTVSKHNNVKTPIGDFLEEGLLALVPYYESGYKSVIVTSKGSYPDKRSVPWLIKSIARVYSRNLKEIRKCSRQFLKMRSFYSLPFTEHLVLLPVKLRELAAPNETTVGYVSLVEVDRIIRQPESAANSP